MSTEDLGSRLRSVVVQLRSIASDFASLSLSPTEEVMLWPLGFVVEDDDAVGLWCAKENCLLDCHNAQIHIDPNNFTLADLVAAVLYHAERNADRAGGIG